MRILIECKEVNAKKSHVRRALRDLSECSSVKNDIFAKMTIIWQEKDVGSWKSSNNVSF